MKIKTYLVFLILPFFVSCNNDEIVSIDAEKITLNHTSIELEGNNTLQLIATVSPSNTTDKEVVWKSSDTTIVSVNNTGVIKPINIGSAEITASTNNNKSAICEITVNSSSSWDKIANFDNDRGRYGAVSFSIGDKAYVGLGSDEAYSYDVIGDEYTSYGGSYKNDFWEYNSETDTWRKLSDFPGGERTGAIGFSINGKGYVGLGTYSDGILNDGPFTSSFEFMQDFWEYNPSNDTWTQLSDFPGAGRTKSAGFVMNDKGYVACGRGRDPIAKRDFWEFSPSDNSWNQLVDYPEEGGPSVGFGINNKGYVGFRNSSSRLNFWEYSPDTNSWNQKQSAETPDTYFDVTGFSFNDAIYICLDINSLLKYNPINNEWTNLIERFPDSMRQESKTSFVVNDKAFLGLGYHSSFCGNHCSSVSPTSSIYQFIP